MAKAATGAAVAARRQHGGSGRDGSSAAAMVLGSVAAVWRYWRQHLGGKHGNSMAEAVAVEAVATCRQRGSGGSSGGQRINSAWPQQLPPPPCFHHVPRR